MSAPIAWGQKKWTVTTPSGVCREITCPRCGGDERSWLKPNRREYTLGIIEAEIKSINIECHTRGGGGPRTLIRYETTPFFGTLYHDGRQMVHLTREAAEAAGAIALKESKEREPSEWEQENERRASYAGQNILDALKAEADHKFKELDEKVDSLRQKMLDTIRCPSIDGPQLSKPSYGSPELTTQSLGEWLNGLLCEADLEGFSEEELHEAGYHC